MNLPGFLASQFATLYIKKKETREAERLSSQFSLQTRNPIASTFKLQNACQPPPLLPPTVIALSKVCSALSKVKLVVIVGPELQFFLFLSSSPNMKPYRSHLQLNCGLLSLPSLTHIRFSSAFFCFISVLSFS
ncbi:hypothetical protein AHAS_Ahas13G0147800 [Arachis hypogaea]